MNRPRAMSHRRSPMDCWVRCLDGNRRIGREAAPVRRGDATRMRLPVCRLLLPDSPVVLKADQLVAGRARTVDQGDIRDCAKLVGAASRACMVRGRALPSNLCEIRARDALCRWGHHDVRQPRTRAASVHSCRDSLDTTLPETRAAARQLSTSRPDSTKLAC